MAGLRWLLIAVLALLCSVSCIVINMDDTPQVVLDTVNYDKLMEMIADHHGQVVVVDFWSTSCEPCMREFEHLVTLSTKYPRQLACISVSLDYEGVGTPDQQVTKVLAFLTKQNATFENVLASEDSDTMFKKLQIPSIPAVFVYDRDGKIAERFDKPGFTYQDVGKRVAELISQ